LISELLTGSSYPVFIQVGDNGLYADPLSLQPLGGNVGIGTTTPARPLEVNGNERLTNGFLELYNGSTSLGYFGAYNTINGGTSPNDPTYIQQLENY